ncbi:hypothetical protein FRC04_005069 [Tulasnella sp. 424]|nr:hypothetical protein FRC04_005069 [Tulasnella sp. 424]
MPASADEDDWSIPARQAEAADELPAWDNNNNKPKSGVNDVIVLDTSEDEDYFEEEDPLGEITAQGKSTKYATGEDGTYHLIAREINIPELCVPLSQISGPMMFRSSFAEMLDQDAPVHCLIVRKLPLPHPQHSPSTAHHPTNASRPNPIPQSTLLSLFADLIFSAPPQGRISGCAAPVPAAGAIVGLGEGMAGDGTMYGDPSARVEAAVYGKRREAPAYGCWVYE